MEYTSSEELKRFYQDYGLIYSKNILEFTLLDDDNSYNRHLALAIQLKEHIIFNDFVSSYEVFPVALVVYLSGTEEPNNPVIIAHGWARPNELMTPEDNENVLSPIGNSKIPYKACMEAISQAGNNHPRKYYNVYKNRDCTTRGWIIDSIYGYDLAHNYSVLSKKRF